MRLKCLCAAFCAEKSRTWPYEYARVGKIWVMRDAPRKNPKDYRKEEWVAYGMPAREVDAVARKATRGRFFVCAVRGMDDSEASVRAGYKELGYRLMATEPLFVHRLTKIPRVPSSVTIGRVTTADMAVRFGKATRTRPIPPEASRQERALSAVRRSGRHENRRLGPQRRCSRLHLVLEHARPSLPPPPRYRQRATLSHAPRRPPPRLQNNPSSSPATPARSSIPESATSKLACSTSSRRGNKGVHRWRPRRKLSGANRVWTYFNNDREGFAIKIARQFARLLK